MEAGETQRASPRRPPPPLLITWSVAARRMAGSPHAAGLASPNEDYCVSTLAGNLLPSPQNLGPPNGQPWASTTPPSFP
eukprot:scaffold334_cov241-Pinguiococcus_pyrenoidosus.AAC.1